MLPTFAFHRKCHERRPSFDDLQSKLPGNAVTEIGGTDLRERKAAASDDNGFCFEGAACGGDLEVRNARLALTYVRATDTGDRTRRLDAHFCRTTFSQQQADDLARRLAAE